MKTIFRLFLSWLLLILGAIVILSSAVPALSIDPSADPDSFLPAAALARQTLPLVVLGILGIFAGVHLRELTFRIPLFCHS